MIATPSFCDVESTTSNQLLRSIIERPTIEDGKLILPAQVVSSEFNDLATVLDTEIGEIRYDIMSKIADSMRDDSIIPITSSGHIIAGVSGEKDGVALFDVFAKVTDVLDGRCPKQILARVEDVYFLKAIRPLRVPYNLDDASEFTNDPIYMIGDRVSHWLTADRGTIVGINSVSPGTTLILVELEKTNYYRDPNVKYMLTFMSGVRHDDFNKWRMRPRGFVVNTL